jgi:hypothetical protein
MLSNFQLGAHPLLQILLLGQPEFRGLLASEGLEQLRQRVIATHHLEPMTLGEVGAYVEHRLTCVGWQGNPGFDQRVYSELAKVSGGVPRRINQIVARLLLLGAVEQRSRIDCSMLDTVLADLARDGAMPGAAPVAPPLQPGHAAPEADLALELAKRDELISELQQAVIELSDHQHEVAGTSDGALTAALEEAIRRLAAIESRTNEQERTIRHTLTMLIEWIETDDPRLVAA